MVTGLSKHYRIGAAQAANRRFTEVAWDALTAPVRRIASARAQARPEETVWALRDVSFRVDKGEVVGVVGRNGAGKSTLLKILSRITEPSSGNATIRGRVGSLLEVGTGFHPELTGRENIFLNGSILGMSRREIDSKLPDIIEFAGIERFLDTPVKRYSSGMGMRLAFSVAAHLEPEILIVDEVLAVGDAAFQRKCIGKMKDVAGAGRTVLFVSHNMEAVTNLCTRALWLDQGVLRRDGPSGEIVREYLASTTDMLGMTQDLSGRHDRAGSGAIRFTRVALRDAQGRQVPHGVCGDPLTVALSYEGHAPDLRGVSVWFWIRDPHGRGLVCCHTHMTAEDFETVPRKGEFICHIPRLQLAPGKYTIDLAVLVDSQSADRIYPAVELEVVQGDFYGTGRSVDDHGYVLCDYSWKVSGEGSRVP